MGVSDCKDENWSALRNIVTGNSNEFLQVDVFKVCYTKACHTKNLVTIHQITENKKATLFIVDDNTAQWTTLTSWFVQIVKGSNLNLDNPH